MDPKIKSGQLCTVQPLGDHVVRKGDIVLCKVKGKHYLHLVEAISQKMDGGVRVQICNNKGFTNGTIGKQSIYGVLVKVED